MRDTPLRGRIRIVANDDGSNGMPWYKNKLNYTHHDYDTFHIKWAWWDETWFRVFAIAAVVALNLVVWL